MKNRCSWASNDLLRTYHDNEWGIPEFDDRKLFEMLSLDIFQAGLSWEQILKKRTDFRLAFDYFEPEIIAKYSQDKISELMKNNRIIRNKMKIDSVINNAIKIQNILEEYDSFSKYLWSFVDNEKVVNSYEYWADVPPKNVESMKMSKSLKEYGFKFVGPTICYAFMQSVGMINDHEVACFRYKRCQL